VRVRVARLTIATRAQSRPTALRGRGVRSSAGGSGAGLASTCTCMCVCAPLRLPKPLSDQFPVRVCACPLCI